jgi:hypothetical protein
MSGGNESLYPRHMIISPFAGLNAMRVFLQYQASMLRVWANSCELAAHNFARGVETFKSAPELKSAPEQRREAA